MSTNKKEDIIAALKSVVENGYFKDMSSALRSNGKSKSVEDFNILDEYQSRFKETPSLLKITHDDCDLFLYEKLKKILKEEFKDSKILFNDTEYNLKRDKYITSREVWYIEDGYLLNLWTSESKNIYANPELDIKMNKHDQLIEGNTLLVPPTNSEKTNKKIEDRIIKSFKTTTIREYERNTIGMLSVDSTGELYVKDFSIDRKFIIKDMDLHYGEGFKVFYDNLFKKLKGDKKGLVLLHGEPGTGKCVDGSTLVTIRNKKTQEIENISIEDFKKRLNAQNIQHIDTIDNNKKFTESIKIDDYEILTDDGFKDVICLHKTINYEVYNLVLDNKELKCADFHTVFLENGDEIFVKNLKPFDKIKTVDGIESVIRIEQLGYDKEMWDFELNGENCKYYTNGVLSHNTFLIRHLLQRLSKTDKKVLYFPPSMVEAVTDPAFFNFITNWTMENGKNSILLIEDAEPLLLSRESTRNMGITNLLNLTDGILNDVLSIQIIATFNTSLYELDKALLRPERLIARKEFKKLTMENAKKLSVLIGLDPDKVTKDMSLAELYSVKNDNEVLIHGVDKNTAAGERNTIGFGNKK